MPAKTKTDPLPDAADIAARLNNPDFRRVALLAGYLPGAEIDVPTFAQALADAGYYLTQDLARRVAGIYGANLVCNRCGTYGATWTDNSVRTERPGWGALALCPPHKQELEAEHGRHAAALADLRRVNFEQPLPRTSRRRPPMDY